MCELAFDTNLFGWMGMWGVGDGGHSEIGIVDELFSIRQRTEFVLWQKNVNFFRGKKAAVQNMKIIHHASCCMLE